MITLYAFGRIFREGIGETKDGFVVAASGAIVLYLAEKAGKLIPADVEGRTRVMQWCFAAASTVEPTIAAMDLVDMTDRAGELADHRAFLAKIEARWLAGLEERLADRTWIACAEFTVADILSRSPMSAESGSEGRCLRPTAS